MIATQPKPHSDPVKPFGDDDATILWQQGQLGKGQSWQPEVVFGQVREDAAIEVEALSLCPRPAVAFCIGSGGCTAFSLLSERPKKLIALDINPAQIYLLDLKKAAFSVLSYEQMLDTMTHDARSVYTRLRPSLGPQARQFWDKRQALLAHGLNGCGLIEQKSEHMMRLLRLFVHSREEIRAMFGQRDLDAQKQHYRAHWDTWRWRLSLRLGLSKPALRRTYGPDFVAAVPANFSELMRQRMESVFTRFPTEENPYLWQAFLGEYPPTQKGLPIYMQHQHFEEVKAGMTDIELVVEDAAAWLGTQPARSIDFFGLSNILEVTSPQYTKRLLEAVTHAAKPGAILCLRFIFPPEAGLLPNNESLELDCELSDYLQQIDRSPFATCIRVLRVRK